MGTVKYSGPVASFHCPTNAEIRSLKVHFSPKQLGEGTPSPENVREIVGWDGVEAYNYTSANASISSIPSEYKKVEYLESTGTQWIYTNVPARYGIECIAQVMWRSGGDTTIFGGRKSTSDRIMLIHQYPSSKWTLGYGTSYTGLSTLNFDTIYTVEAKLASGEQFLRIDGATIYSGTDSTEYSNDFNMALFACSYNSANNVSLRSSARIYSLTARLDGVEVLNVVPCLRKSDSKPGMYDTVSQTFYTNAGTGEFLYGPEVYGYTTNYEFGVLGKNKLNADAEQQVPDNTNMMPTNKRIFTPNTYCVGMSWSNYYTPNNVTSYSVSNSTITVTNGNVYGLGYPVRVTPGQAYYLSATTINGRAHIAYFSSDGTYVSGVSTDTLNKSFTVPSGVETAVIVFYSNRGEATFSNIQLELGSTATAYEPYNPNKTVYGGWVDLVSGEVCEEYNCIDLGTLNYTLRSNIGIGQFSANIGTQIDMLLQAKNLWTGCCSSYKYVGSYNDLKSVDKGVGYIYTTHVDVKDLSVTEDDASAIKSALNGVMLAYELATPKTYHLAPVQLQTFLSQNNIWSNADYVEVEYDLHETQTILARKQFIIANQPHIVKPAAAPLQNFVTDMAAPLKECKVYFSPVQEGTGDPSPDNVRTISGWTGVEVYRTGKNMFSDSTSDDVLTWIRDGAAYSKDVDGRLPSNQQFTLQANITKDLQQNISNCRLYFNGERISGMFINTATPLGIHTVTNKPTENGRLWITHNYLGISPSNYGATFNNMQLELGNTATEYESYTGTTIPITFPSTANLLNSTTITTNKTLSSAGEETSENGMSLTNYIKVNEGDTYKLTFTSKEGARTRRIYGYDANKEPIESLGSTSWVTVDTTGTVQAIISSGVEYIRVCYKTADENIFLEGPESSVIYGGYVDLVTGEVWKEWYLYRLPRLTDSNCTIASQQYIKSDSVDLFVYPATDVRQYPSESATLITYSPMCNRLDFKPKGIWGNVGYPNCWTLNAGQVHFNISNDLLGITDYTQESTATAKAKVIDYMNSMYDAGNYFEFAYKIRPTLLTTLTSTQLKSLRGTNNIWSNTNGNIELKYWTH